MPEEVEGNVPLINIGDLAKPATVLIEKISDAIGGIAKPWHTTRVAEAEGRAEVARARARIEISELEERALQRMVREEGIRQKNIEAITSKSLPQLSQAAKPEDVDPDWIVHLFEKGRLVSDEDMQEYWSSMLAGEANSPGSFSKRTIDLVASMDKRDIQLFNQFCECAWEIGVAIPSVASLPTIEDYRLSFEQHQHLESLGLLHLHSGLGAYAIADLNDPETSVSYFNEAIFLSPIDSAIETGIVCFTPPGRQLYALCKPKYSGNHYRAAIERWIEKGYLPRQRFPKTSKK